MIEGRKAYTLLTDGGLVALYNISLAKSTNGRLALGSIEETAKEFNSSSKTVSLVWKRRFEEDT